MYACVHIITFTHMHPHIIKQHSVTGFGYNLALTQAIEKNWSVKFFTG